MIPTTFLAMLGHSTVQIQCVIIKVRLADCVAMVDKEVSELQSLIGATTAIGLAVYLDPYYSKPAMLQLCVGTQCLLVHLARSLGFISS